MSVPISKTPIPKTFGLIHTTSLVTGNIVGTSLFLMPALLGKYGTISLIGWLFTAIGALLLAHVFARLSHRRPVTGGPYSYSREAFGEFVGFQMAWSYWIANWVSNAAVAVAFVNFLGWFWPDLLNTPLYALGASLATVWSLTLINCISLKSSINVQVITTIVKLLPLGAIVIVGSFHIDFHQFFPLTVPDFDIPQAISAAAALTLFSFVGLETATIPADSVKDPERTIPRATMIGTTLAAGIYIWSCFVIFGILSPAKTALSPSPFSDVGALLFGPTAEKIIAGCAALSCFGTLNGWILLQGQVPYAAAKDNLFPQVFNRLSKQGVPIFGLVFSSVLMSLMLIMNYEMGLVRQFEFIITLTTFAILQPYLYSSAAELYFMFREPAQASSIKIFRESIFVIAAMVYALWALMGAGENIVYLGSFLLFSSLPVYVVMKIQTLKRRS